MALRSPLVARRRARRPWSFRTVLATTGVATLALTAAACSGGPGDRDDLVSALTRDDTFEQAEAECIADRVFDEYGEDEDAIGMISGADDYETLTGAEGVAGFDEFFTTALEDCT